MRLSKIVSGGQTGVDRGALDAALELGFPCGGWCPPGRLAEDGPIDRRYPLVEMVRGGYEERTRQNVVDSDGTAVLYFGVLEGGTAFTVRLCELEGRACKVIDASKVTQERAADLVASFVKEHVVSILNVAGPRESKVPSARAYAHAVIKRVLQSGTGGAAAAG